MKKTILISLLISAQNVFPCSRVVWSPSADVTLTGRSMDWLEDIGSNLWLFPKGIERSGQTNVNPLKWTSKYGSLALTAYDIGTADGLNEEGLAVNLNYLSESKFGARDSKVPGLSVSLWAQYYLDNFSTVEEAVVFTKKNPFQVVNVGVPTSQGMKYGTVHLSISDRTGDSAIFEYIEGKLQIYQSKNYKVMTNSPTFDQQIKQLSEFKGFGGTKSLPGTTDAGDRFVRASFYLQNLPPTKDEREAVASVLGVLRNVSQPLGTVDPNRPHISPTRWRVVADQKNMKYYYENTSSPFMIWVDLKALNFKKGQSVQKLELVKKFNLVGDLSKNFKPSPSFTFLPATSDN